MSPPYLQETPKQYVFNPDLGRTLELTLDNTEECNSQCENFMFFLSLRFYVKSIFENLEVPNLPF